MVDTEIDALIDAGARIYGFEIKPEWRPAIRMHMRISLGHAGTVLAEDLDDHVDPAPVFQA
jgi:Protein of unknown function (DUF4089)